MYYAGIDAHATYLSIAVVDKNGVILQEATIKVAQHQQLLEVLAPYRPLDVVVETCPFWPWIHDYLGGRGIGFHLAHANDLVAIANSKRKSDRVDARLLARMLAAGLIPEVYPKDLQQRELLKVIRHRCVLMRYRTSLANRIHAQLHESRIHLPRETLLRKKTRPWLREHAWPQLTDAQRDILGSHFRLIRSLETMIRSLDRRIEEEANESAAALLLQTIPGIGPYRGLLLDQELAPITRFREPRHLVSYAGLAPVTQSSGGRTHHGHIPRGANRWVRSALVSAIPTHVGTAPASKLSQHYRDLSERLGWQTARVATARKLAIVIHHMLRTGECWNEDG